MDSQPPSTPAALFLDFSRSKLSGQYWPRLRSCVESLTDQQIWWRPNAPSNSIGNLVLHLNGNMRQWIVAAFNSQPDRRDRPAEFAAHAEIPGPALLSTLGVTVDESLAIIGRLTEADLVAPMRIQGYDTTGLGAIYQVIEHFGLHFGQIAWITKMLLDQDLGFYRELNPTGRAS